MGIIAVGLIAFVSLFIPGFLLSLALLRKTDLHLFEISIIGFIFGLVGPATMTWIESYLINYVHAFSFSLGLFEANALALGIIGLALCIQQKAFDGLFAKKAEAHHLGAHGKKFDKRVMTVIWVVLLALMLVTFLTRIANIGISPKFFEFDPYFDMIDAKSVVTLGYQFLLDPSAWPVIAGGTNHRVQPLIPYLTAYWYDLANAFGFHHATFSTSLMSYVGSIYPPIAAALLVFVIFVLLYHEYDPYVGLIGAGLTAAMPVLLTTFIAGEQLLEPWGIFSLFFFFAVYLLAIKKPKSIRLAILAGIAFATTFLGAHYFTVTAGVLTVYILLQGVIDVLRGDISKDFYKMNTIVLIVIALFLLVYQPYNASAGNGIPTAFGIPITILMPLVALIFVAVLDYLPKLAKKYNLALRNTDFSAYSLKVRNTYLIWLILLVLITLAAIFLTPIGNPLRAYLKLSYKFTNPSSALFMTVQEFQPTGLFYNFGSAGFGLLGSHTVALTLLIPAIALILIAISIIFRKSRTGVLYMAIALPLMYAGFKEAKYLPHLGVVVIMLFGIILGELVLISDHGFKFRFKEPGIEGYERTTNPKHIVLQRIILAIGLFFVSSILAIVYLLAVMLLSKPAAAEGAAKNPYAIYLGLVIAIFVIIVLASALMGSAIMGESSSIVNVASAAVTYSSQTPTNACNTMANRDNAIGYQMFCSIVPQYWLEASNWLATNVGPSGPRVLAWWDYGDWINWFGNTNAVIRGDNSVPKEDYATAAAFVLGPKDNYTQSTLASILSTNQTKYLLFDDQLVSKWGALDFLGCVDINATSAQYATQQGALQSPPTPYELGNSKCELDHDPAFVLIPLAALYPQEINQSQINIQSLVCPISTPNVTYYKGYVVYGQSLSNQTVCIPMPQNTNSYVMPIYNQSGVKMNAFINYSYYQGVVNLGSTQFVQFLMIYTPDGPNGTITDAPTEFYTSNFYKGFFLGQLPGFYQAYPANATGVNYVNGYYPIRIFALDNFTGTLPAVPQKPSWVVNNYTMP